MWGGGGLITVVCAVVLFGLWLHRSEPGPTHPTHSVTETPLGAVRPAGGGSG
jgi:hypothetical protein